MKKIILISLLIMAIIFVSGCQENEVYNDSVMSEQFIVSAQKLIIDEPVKVVNAAIIDKTVYASDNHFDLEELVIEEGQVIELVLVTKNDSYYSLEGIEDFEVLEESPYTMVLKALKKGTYNFACSFKCTQADLAKELIIKVE